MKIHKDINDIKFTRRNMNSEGEGLRNANTETKFVSTQWIAKRWDMHEEAIRGVLRSGKLAGFEAGPVTWRIPLKAVLAYESGNAQSEGLEVSEPIVMASAAGWYVGAVYKEPECDGMIAPYRRDTHYVATPEEAEQLLPKEDE